MENGCNHKENLLNKNKGLSIFNSATTVLTLLGNTESPLEPLLQVMWTKMCCLCVIFPCNRLGCHYPHTHQTQGSGLNYPLLPLSFSLSKISFEVFWLFSAFSLFLSLWLEDNLMSYQIIWRIIREISVKPDWGQFVFPCICVFPNNKTTTVIVRPYILYWRMISSPEHHDASTNIPSFHFTRQIELRFCLFFILHVKTCH